MGRLHTWLLFICTALILAGCGFQPKTADVGPRGTVRFKGNPPDAILEINETRLGPISMFQKQGVLLKPGSHRVIVKKEGYFDDYILIEVVENQLQTLNINLRSIPN